MNEQQRFVALPFGEGYRVFDMFTALWYGYLFATEQGAETAAVTESFAWKPGWHKREDLV